MGESFRNRLHLPLLRVQEAFGLSQFGTSWLVDDVGNLKHEILLSFHHNLRAESISKGKRLENWLPSILKRCLNWQSGRRETFQPNNSSQASFLPFFSGKEFLATLRGSYHPPNPREQFRASVAAWGFPLHPWWQDLPSRLLSFLGVISA